MKKLTLIFLIICTYSSAFAQKEKFEIGIQAGNSIENMKHTGPTQHGYGYSSKLAFSASLFLQYKLNDHFSLRIEPGYSKKGYNTSYDSTFYENGYPTRILIDFPITANFNYLTMPILVRASIGKKIKYFINAGPCIGFLLSQNTIYNYGVVDYEKPKYNTINNYKTLDLGITSGLGMSIPMKNIFSFSLEFRNNIGLMNISNSSNSTDKTLSFCLLAGFSYRIGGKITKDQAEIIYIK